MFYEEGFSVCSSSKYFKFDLRIGAFQNIVRTCDFIFVLITVNFKFVLRTLVFKFLLGF